MTGTLEQHRGGELQRSSAYGLEIASCFAIPELPNSATDRAHDVLISLGEVPSDLSEVRQRGRQFQANDRQFIMDIADVGRYLIEAGERIVVQPAPDADEHEVRVFLLGTGLGVMLHQRGFLVLHASGIATSGGAVLFAGESGAGKSTILRELMHRGYRMIVDDVCAVTATDGEVPMILPAYPRTRLWSDSAARFSIDTSALERTRPSMDKYEMQVPEHFHADPLPLRALFVLTSEPGAEVRLERVPPVEAFGVVLGHTYRGQMLDGLDRRREHFAHASNVVSTTPVLRSVRASDRFAVEELADAVLQALAHG